LSSAWQKTARGFAASHRGCARTLFADQVYRRTMEPCSAPSAAGILAILSASTSTRPARPTAPTIKRGLARSGDSRPDCRKVVIALIVTPVGFPPAYEGNGRQHVGTRSAQPILCIIERYLIPESLNRGCVDDFPVRNRCPFC